MGNFSIAIYYKLFEGLKKKIPDNEKRKKHIIEKQLFMGELNKKNCYIIKQIFNINDEYSLNLYEGDTLAIDINNVFGRDMFDVIIGNPPYNELLTSSGAKPLYNKFIEYYVEKCYYMSFVIPSRWFSGGKGLDKFRSMMLKRRDICYIRHFDDASVIFGNHVGIQGGVNYFLIDKHYEDDCEYNGEMIDLSEYDILVDSKYCSIIDKMSNHEKITSIYLGRYFSIETNDKRLCDDNSLLKCYTSKQKGFIKYIDRSHINKDYAFYKVITARANGDTNCGFGNTFIGNIEDVHTGSYISFRVNSIIEAQSLNSYLHTKFANFMLSIRKISQDISKKTLSWIPLPPLDKIWSDEELFIHYKLTKKEQKIIIESNIKTQH